MAQQKPTVSYAVYLVMIFALLLLIVVGFKGTNLNNYCMNKEIDCQVYLQSGAKSPYRNNIVAPYTGWHFAGHVPMQTCWVGPPRFCDYCNDTTSERTTACQSHYPGYTTKPGNGVPMSTGKK